MSWCSSRPRTEATCTTKAITSPPSMCMCSRETTEAVSWEAKDSRADPSSPSSSLALSPSSSEALDSNRGLSTPPHDCMLHMSLQSSIQATSSSPCRNSESSSFISGFVLSQLRGGVEAYSWTRQFSLKLRGCCSREAALHRQQTEVLDFLALTADCFQRRWPPDLFASGTV